MPRRASSRCSTRSNAGGCRVRAPSSASTSSCAICARIPTTRPCWTLPRQCSGASIGGPTSGATARRSPTPGLPGRRSTTCSSGSPRNGSRGGGPGGSRSTGRRSTARPRWSACCTCCCPYSETPTIDAVDLPLRKLLQRLKGPAETDAAFLVRRFETIHPTSFGRETIYERIGIPLVLAPGPGTPSRTLAKHESGPPVFQTRPLDRSRPVLRSEIVKPPHAVRSVPPEEADRLIDLAREAMVTRGRDLDNFIHADRDDVRIFEYADGLAFACYGLTPERRLLLESVYGMLTLKNGVPIGYVLASGLFGSSEVMYNVFDTFRGGESARIYGRVLSMARVLFGADTFTIDPFQLGHANSEGQKSGAFWFYDKLGFRPIDAKALGLDPRGTAPAGPSSGRTLEPGDDSPAVGRVRLPAHRRAAPRRARPGVDWEHRPARLAPAGRARRGRPRAGRARVLARGCADPRRAVVRRLDRRRAPRVGSLESPRARARRRRRMAGRRSGGARRRDPRQGRPPRVGLRAALRSPPPPAARRTRAGRARYEIGLRVLTIIAWPAD